MTEFYSNEFLAELEPTPIHDALWREFRGEVPSTAYALGRSFGLLQASYARMGMQIQRGFQEAVAEVMLRDD